MIKIVTDSTCNLTPEQLQQYDIRVAPITIQFGLPTYTEGVDLSLDLFYTKIEQLGILPSTLPPSPAVFAGYYRELAALGHSILVITITQKHSGTFSSALLAKDLVPEADVEVFDSATISLGTGYMVLEAARAAQVGQSRARILERLAEIRGRMSFLLTPDTLKYLRMSGRVGGLRAALGSFLDTKPIIQVQDGLLTLRESVRTRTRAIDRLLDLTVESLGAAVPLNIGVVHARAHDDARLLVERARASFTCREILVHELVASLAVHGGPGVLCLFACRV